MSIEAGLQAIPGHILTRPLGQGAFGQVWEATRPGGRVALKFLDTRKISREAISLELKLMRGISDLKHPYLMGLQGAHACGQYVVLIMECADGNLEDLRQAYQQQTSGNIPPDHALELLAQAADALDFLSRTKVVGSSLGLQHCDVKPTNLLLLGNTLKVADFGLCAGTGWTTHRGGGWRGTPPYAAPELFHGRPAPATDQFALAVTFCEMVIGERAFFKSPPSPTEQPIDLTQLREAEFPVIARALHQYPSSRWPTCKVFIQELTRAAKATRSTTRIYPRGRCGSLKMCPA